MNTGLARARHPRARVALAVTCAAALCVSPGAQAPPQTQRPPVFRAGANFVVVDAYPTRDGKVVEGLTAAEFEVREDGQVQTLESVEFVRVDPTADDLIRRDPNSLNDMRAQAADPRSRVVVAFLDTLHTTVAGSYRIRPPLVDTLNRITGPDDLFGVTTPNHRPQDLTLGRRRESVEEQLSRYWTWGVRQTITTDANDLGEDDLTACFEFMRLPGGAIKEWNLHRPLIERRREDRTLTAIEDLIAYIGPMREARTVLMVISDGWLLPDPQPEVMNSIGQDVRAQAVPGVDDSPVGGSGTRRIGQPIRPAGARDVRFPACIAEAARLLTLDQEARFRRLMLLANRNNVSVYPVSANGLTVFDEALPANRRPLNGSSEGATLLERDYSRARSRHNSLRTIAENTDGIAVVDTNDLAGGMRKIVDDVSAYYLLGYYSTNTKFDGKYRKIEVKATVPGLAMHARRGYMAPAAPNAVAAATTGSASAPNTAVVDEPLAMLGRIADTTDVFVSASAMRGVVTAAVEVASRRISAAWLQGFTVHVEVSDQTGRRAGESEVTVAPGARGALAVIPVGDGPGPWRIRARASAAGESLEGLGDAALGSGSLLGPPVLLRGTSSTRIPLRPVADLQFRRTERAQVEWPLLAAADRTTARLLDRRGAPLPVTIAVTQRAADGAMTLVADVLLAPLPEGDFIVELIVTSAERSDRGMMPLRIIR